MRKSNKKYYITKDVVARAAHRAFKKASNKAMRVHGYVMVAKDGWVVKEFADGSIERIKEIPQPKKHQLHLD